MDGNPFKARKWCRCTRLTWDETQFLHLKPTEVVCMNFSVYFGPMLWRRGYRNMKFTTAWARDRRRAPHQPTSDVRPFGTSRDVQNCRMVRDGRGRKCIKMASCRCRWHACVGRIFLTHDTFTEKSLTHFHKPHSQWSGHPTGELLGISQPAGATNLLRLSRGFRVFFAEKTLLGESKVCRSLWQSLDAGRVFWFDAFVLLLVNWWRRWFPSQLFIWGWWRIIWRHCHLLMGWSLNMTEDMGGGKWQACSVFICFHVFVGWLFYPWNCM